MGISQVLILYHLLYQTLLEKSTKIKTTSSAGGFDFKQCYNADFDRQAATKMIRYFLLRFVAKNKAKNAIVNGISVIPTPIEGLRLLSPET